MTRLLVTALISAAAVVLVSAAGPNTAAACRGTGAMTANPNGVKYTTWSDGAWLRQYPDGRYEWQTPAGSEPLPGISPGHNPHR